MRILLKRLFLLLVFVTISNQAFAFDKTSLTENQKKLTPEYMANFEKYHYDEDGNYILLNNKNVQFADNYIIFDIIMPSEHEKYTSLLVVEADLAGNRFRRYTALTFNNKNYKVKKLLFTEPKNEWESFSNYPIMKKIAQSVADKHNN